MNIILLEDIQFESPARAKLSIRQHTHITNILKTESGARVRIGRVNGKLGSAVFHADETNSYLTDIELTQKPPAGLDVTLILALPRPQMLKRILQTVATFGIAKLVLIHTNKVEKSFWQSPSATDTAIREHLILGLEQARATQLPTVEKHTRFKPFIQEHCERLLTGNTRKILAHPGENAMFPSSIADQKLAIAIGPEGGFNEFEVEQFLEAGFESAHLGERILRVETAVNTVLARVL